MPSIPEHVMRELRAISPQLSIRQVRSDRPAVVVERTRSGQYKPVLRITDDSGRPCSPDSRHLNALRYGANPNRVLKEQEVREAKEVESRDRALKNNSRAKLEDVVDRAFHMDNKNGYLKGRLRKSRDPVSKSRTLILAYDHHGNKVYDARS